MLSLLNAIYAFFNASGLNDTFAGGLFRDRAPEGTALPYVVSHVLSSKATLSYGSTMRTTTQIKFSAVGIGHDATATLMQALVFAFDSDVLVLASGTNDAVMRLGDTVPKLLRHDGQGNDVWEWSVVYEYGVAE